MAAVGKLIAKVIKEKENAVSYVKQQVKMLCDAYPLYADMSNL
jgi:hypothetical protein